MQTWHIVAAVGALAAVGVVALAVRGMSKDQLEGSTIDASVVQRYCQLVAEERYDEAFATCLTSEYRSASNPEAFAKAHKKRLAELGPVQGRKLLDVRASSNLFSGVRSYQLHYEVRYASGPIPLYAVVDDSDGEPRIEGTYRSGGSDGLNFQLW